MIRHNGKYIDPELDPTARIITYREVVIYIVSLCFAIVIALFVGFFIGRQSVKNEVAIKQESKPISTQNINTSSPPKVDFSGAQVRDTNPVATQPSSQTVVTDSGATPTNSSSGDTSDDPVTNLLQNTNSSTTDLSKASSPSTQTDSSISSVDTKSEEVNSKPTSAPPNSSPPPAVDLQPITPPIDVDTSAKQQTEHISQSTAQPKTFPVRKAKTYAVQLSVLTGQDAQARAESVLKAVSSKYPQFQFTIEKVGNAWKILAINFSKEKDARDAMRILSQESNFRGAFIIKP